MTAHPREMVPFVGVGHMITLINKVGVQNLMRDLAERLETDFRRWVEFDKIPRIAAHIPDGVVELMPTSDGRTYAFKYVNGHPENTQKGLQTVTAFGVVADMATGYPTLITEMTLLTALRTAVTSAVAAKYLARPESRVMAMIGCGAQSEFQALAFAAICGIAEIRLFDLDPAAVAKCAAHLKRQGLTVMPCRSVEHAVEGADIITTVTADKRQAQILGGNHVGPGIHINAVGGDCPGKTELDPRILLRGRTFVEFEPQTRIEGELQHMPATYPCTALADVISGVADGRQNDWEITIFDSVGFAVEDFSALTYIADLARQHACFALLDMIAAPEDPRDLFGLIGV